MGAKAWSLNWDRYAKRTDLDVSTDKATLICKFETAEASRKRSELIQGGPRIPRIQDRSAHS